MADQTPNLKTLDKEQLKAEHLTAQDELASVKRAYMQQQGKTYDDLTAAALRVVNARDEINERAYGKRIPISKCYQMLLGLMR